MTIVRRAWACALALMLLVGLPVARAAAAETFVAGQACPAYQSISKKTNPGGVRLAKGQAYTVVNHNKEPPTWLQVRIAGAQPTDRWVPVDCKSGGGASPAPTPTPTPGPTPSPGPSAQGKSTHLLALSWQPTFCATHAAKTECKAETAQSPDARQLSLHGLWPQPIGFYYCIADPAEKARLSRLDAQGEWDQMPDPGLSPAVRARLAVMMPGTQSLLDRHEWYKHGTCFGGSPDAYFSRAADLVEQINGSAVGRLISSNVGQSVTTEQILAAFDSAFGAGASSGVLLKPR